MAPTIPPSSRAMAVSDDRTPSASASASAIVAGAASGYHVLRIDGYSRARSALANGKHVQSRPFRVAGRTWAIKYYPNGDRPETAGHISLYLLLRDPVADAVVVQFEFSFVDQVEKQEPSHVGSLPARRFVANGSWGYKQFVKREDLEQSPERLKDDCLTIRCDVMVTGPPRAGDAVAFFVVVPPPDWPQHFRALLLGGRGADVRFLVGAETFAAHRCVLAARSPVFDALLFGAMREGTAAQGYIQIDDMIPQVFKNLLHFIYTDSLPETEWQDQDAGAAMAQHLLEAADRYGMQRLKLICEDRLCRRVDVSTVATSLALADQHRCQGLKEACFEFLRYPKTLDAVMETDGFQHLAKNCPSALYELLSKLASR